MLKPTARLLHSYRGRVAWFEPGQRAFARRCAHCKLPNSKLAVLIIVRQLLVARDAAAQISNSSAHFLWAFQVHSRALGVLKIPYQTSGHFLGFSLTQQTGAFDVRSHVLSVWHVSEASCLSDDDPPRRVLAAEETLYRGRWLNNIACNCTHVSE